MAWNVLLPRKIDEIGLEQIEDFSTFHQLDRDLSVKEAYERISMFDAIILRGGLTLDKEVLSNSESLKIISKYGVGIDNVDLDAATKRRIFVCNSPGSNSNAVAEHVFSLVLAVKRGIVQADKETKNGEWNTVSGDFREKFKSAELRNSTLGLYGCGNIGERVAKIAEGFGMECIAFDPYIDEYDIFPRIKMVDTKEDLLDRADILSVHTPLTEETQRSIAKEELARLKDSSIIINTARGGVIAEEDLLEALQSEELGGAGLDVFVEEPLEKNNPFKELDNVVITPHMGGATIESDREKSIRSCRNVFELFNGELPQYAINGKDFIDIPRCRI